MKKLAYILVPALMLSLVSCDKKEETTPTPQPQTPTGPTAPSINIAGVDAAFIGLTMTFTSVTAGVPIDLTTESGIAAVYSAPYSTTGTNTMIDAGTINVNNIALEKGTTNAYFKSATVGQTPSDLGFSSGMVWTAAGNANFPAINRNVYSSAPDFNGTIPETVTRTSPLTFTFNNSTTPFADSVYVVLISGSTNKLWRYKGNAGTITIPASELSSFSASSTTSPAYIEICPWNALYITEGLPTKNCVYIRERAIVKSVTVN